jgi:hypothetical protein
MITSGVLDFIFNRKKIFFFSFDSIMSALSTALGGGQIIGLVIGIISAIATLICCIIFIYSCCCQNKNRNTVRADEPPPYYYQNRGYEQNVSPYYHYQQPTMVSTNRY